jgi:hypothetical protein
MKIKKVQIPIYFGTLIIIISEDYKEVASKYRLDLDVNCHGAFCWDKTSKDGYAEYYICIDKDVSNHLIAHEVVHLVNFIFKRIGVKLDIDNDEPQAYLTGWLFSQIEKTLFK